MWLNTHPLCEECKRRGVFAPATVVDHITPHQGNWDKFNNPGNLQSLCAPCHSKKTAKSDGAFGNPRKHEKYDVRTRAHPAPAP